MCPVIKAMASPLLMLPGDVCEVRLGRGWMTTPGGHTRGWTVSQWLFTYGLWILLGLIFLAMVVFGVSACRIDHRQSLREEGEMEQDKER